MVDEARLEPIDEGLVPAGPGWFVLSAREAAWIGNDAFGARCVFEADEPVLRRRPEHPRLRFEQLGVTLAVLEPGKPSGLYHAESAQEDFLVLAGECLLLVEEEERRLRAWDFVHCPPGTAHAFVGAGAGPCVLLMVGARTPGRTLRYPRSQLALGHGAGVEAETSSPREAYAALPHWQPRQAPPLPDL
jgi:uncharacterized cupin superfamily protein